MTHPGGIIWISGAPASGKTTLAEALYARLRSASLPVLWLDSDHLRAVMTPHATFSAADRDAFYATLGFLSLRAEEGGVLALVSATASKARYRQKVRERAGRFVEILLRASLEERKRRDPKGLYRRAARGEVHNLPGFDIPFDEGAAEVVLDSEHAAVSELVPRALSELEQRWQLRLR